jgi:hypothetical protein
MAYVIGPGGLGKDGKFKLPFKDTEYTVLKDGVYTSVKVCVNSLGFDKDGNYRDGTRHDNIGFNAEGIHKITRTRYGLDGFDWNGFNRDGYHQNGTRWFETPFGGFYDVDMYNRWGFSFYGEHRNGTPFDNRGFGRDGKHRNGSWYDNNGFTREGYYRDGSEHNERGFNWCGNHRNGTRYNEEGLNILGLNRDQVASMKRRAHILLAYKAARDSGVLTKV